MSEFLLLSLILSTHSLKVKLESNPEKTALSHKAEELFKQIFDTIEMTMTEASMEQITQALEEHTKTFEQLTIM